MHTFPLTITTLGEILYQGNVRSVTAPGISGELTILANHVEIVTPLKKGEVIVRGDGEEKKFPIERGLLEMNGREVVILL